MIRVLQFCIFLAFSYITMMSRAALGDVITETSSLPLIPCEKEWFFYGNKCYKVFGKEDRLSWTDARESCFQKGGRLVTIQTQELQDFLFHFLLQRAIEDTWIGLHVSTSDYRYTWTDSSVVNYTNWDADNYMGNCVGMRHWTGKWRSVYCWNSLPYMCQSDKNEQLSNPDPAFCPSEKGGGLKFFDSCYHTVALKKSWYDAEKYCQDNFNGHLITILNSKVQSFMDYMAQKFDKKFWIGIQIRDQTLQKWSSGWPVYFYKWNKIFNDFKEDSCGLRSDENLWAFAQCADEFPFICETHNALPALKEAPKGWLCPTSSKDWKDFGGDKCYIFVTNITRKWDDANADCKTKGGVLAVIQSEEESKALHPYVICTQTHLYIGLHRRADNKNIFQWADGSDLHYENWLEGEPNYSFEECVMAWTDNMKWYDEKCYVAWGYICSAKKVPPSLEEKKEHSIKDSCQCECPIQPCLEEKKEHPVTENLPCECPIQTCLEEKKEHTVTENLPCECPIQPCLEENKEHLTHERLQCECSNCTGEKAALGVFIFICAILVVGLAVYFKKVPCSTRALFH